MTETVIIRKQQFRIKTGSQELALQLRRELNDHLQVGLLAVYEEVFSTMPALLQDTVYIDKLSLNLGRCSAEEFSTRLPTLLRQAMLKKLKQEDAQDEIKIKMATGREDREHTYPSGATDEASALFHFFEKGYYPWWVGGVGEKRKPAEVIAVLDEWTLESILIKVVSASRQFGKEKGENIRKRFLQHLPANDHTRIIDALIALQSDQQLRKNLQLLTTDETLQYCCAFFSFTTIEYREELIRFLLQTSLEQVKDVLQSFVAQLMKKKKAAEAGIEALKKEVNKDEVHISRIQTAIAAIIGEIDKEDKGSNKNDAGIPGTKSQTGDSTTGISGSESKSNMEVPGGQQSPGQNAKQNAKHNPADELPEEGVYMENGGLVILHPFFQPLFTELELVTIDGQFVNDDAKMRAAVILDYLLTGNTQYAEYDMLLNKLICGIPAEEVLPNDIILAERETRECDELMNTVLQYWEALKGAGTEAVRETFFHRKAKVRFKDDHWLLQVERNAADILLDRLPWGIGIIRLPWLQYLIHVEW